MTVTTVRKTPEFPSAVIHTPDHRVRVFVSSTLNELAEERQAAREAIERLRLTPVLFEMGARSHPAAALYRAYLAQSDIFIGIYWQHYGWIAPGEEISGLEDEYRRSGDKPRLIYVKKPALEREESLQRLLDQIEVENSACYKQFHEREELRELIENDLALLLTETFALGRNRGDARQETVPEHRHNLPIQRSAILGRESETDRARKLLVRHDAGLVTLTGTGGSGKTRLALHVAATLVPHFSDGVWLVPLASLTDANLVPSAIAQALGVREANDRSVLESIADHLRDKHLLLVLDNFEHLMPAAPVVTELLEKCERLKILAASRSPLRVRGEKELIVPPLALPDRSAEMSLERLQQYAAIRLFIERARDINPDFVLDRNTAPAVVAICARLDGLPLAIELAAARIKLLPPRALLARLDRRLPLLTGGARDLPGRQRALHKTIEWSYDLLDEEAQRIFRHLAVFAGSFSLGAAEFVSSGKGPRADGDTDQSDILTGVQVLLDQSLLYSIGERDHEPRFGMLETIREYGLERLTQSGENVAARHQHATYYLETAREAEVKLAADDQDVWLKRLESDHDNLRAALAWCRSDRADSDRGLELAGSLWRFWYVRGHLREGAQWLQDLLAVTDEVVSPERSKALRGAGAMLYLQRKLDGANTYFQRALAMYRALGDREGEAACLNNLAIVCDEQGDKDAARSLYEQALSLRREMNDRFGIASALSNLGVMAHFARDYDRARELYEEGLVIERELGNIGGIAISLANLGELKWHQGDWMGAIPYLREGLELGAKLGDTDVIANCLNAFGHVALQLGDRESAARLHGAVESLRDATGSPTSLQYLREFGAHIDEARGVLKEGQFSAFWSEGRTMSRERAISLALGLARRGAEEWGEKHPISERATG